MRARHRAGEVVGTVCVAVLSALLGLSTWTVLPVVAGWTPTVVLSGSMAPRLQPGDVVVSSPARAEHVVEGRVLLFEDPSRPGVLLVHRAVAVGDDGSVVTQGDANRDADPVAVEAESVVGIPRLRVPGVGLPVLWARSGDWPRVAVSLVGLYVIARGAVAAVGPLRARAAHRRAVVRTPASASPIAVVCVTALVATSVLAAAGVASAAFTATTASTSAFAAAGTFHPSYTPAVQADHTAGTGVLLPLDDTTGGTNATAVNAMGTGAGTFAGTSAASPVAAGAIAGDPDTAVRFVQGGYASTSTQVSYAEGTPVTVAVWFRTTTPSGSLMHLSSVPEGDGDAQAAPRLWLNGSGEPCIVARGVSTGLSSICAWGRKVDDGQWHLLALVHDGTGARVVIDGVDGGWALTGIGQPTAASGYWRLGADAFYQGGVNPYFVGDLDEASVWTRAVSASELLAQYQARATATYWSVLTSQTPVPQFHWRLGDGGAGQMTSAIGDNPGTYRGLVPTATAFVLGVPGALKGPEAATTAVRFAGTADLTTAWTPTASAMARQSVELWFRTTTSSGGALATLLAGSTVDRALFVTADGRVGLGWTRTSGDEASVLSPASYADGAWHLATATVDAAAQRVRLYVDGVLVASGTGTVATTGTEWRFGGAGGASLAAFPGGPVPTTVTRTVLSDGFEDGTAAPFTPNGANAWVTNADRRSGTSSLQVDSRTAEWGSARLDLLAAPAALTPGQYEFSAWVRLLGGVGPTGAHVTVQQDGSQYVTVGTYRAPVTSTGWTRIGGTYTLPAGATSASMYVEVQPIGTSHPAFLLDDVVITRTGAGPGSYLDADLDVVSVFADRELTAAQAGTHFHANR